MSTTKRVQEIAKTLKLHALTNEIPNLLTVAKEEQLAYVDFLHRVLDFELQSRITRAYERRMQAATFPYNKTLDDFSLEEQQSLNKKQFNQLSSLEWVDQCYNLVLLGPTGVGKTHLSVGLGIKAVEQGFKVVFVTMGEMVRLLKTQDITTRSANKIKRMKDADMIILDDLMFMALSKQEANQFFHFINEIHETTSIVLTSNKAPQEWGELIGDKIITAAILDRIVQKSEIIQLSGESYRVKHRQTIFKD